MKDVISKLCYIDKVNHSYLLGAGVIKSDVLNLYIKK